MATHITSTGEAATGALLFSGERWFDPIEDAVRARVRGFIEEVLEAELTEALRRPRYKRLPATEGGAGPPAGQRHGHRQRTLLGTFGPVEIKAPRARLEGVDGATREWKSKSLQSYQRRTRQADALVAGAYLSGTNTRRVKRALACLFKGAVGKDVVSRAWRKVATDWEAWGKRDLTSVPEGSNAGMMIAAPFASIVMVSVATAARWKSGATMSMLQSSGQRPSARMDMQFPRMPAWLSITPFERPVVPPV